jgi:hypothetical protein
MAGFIVIAQALLVHSAVLRARSATPGFRCVTPGLRWSIRILAPSRSMGTSKDRNNGYCTWKYAGATPAPFTLKVWPL